MTVTLNDPREECSNNILIVQLESQDERDVACAGNTIFICRRGTRTTLYGKDRLKLFVNGASYAVYYAIDRLQWWLIHTNYQNPHFDSFHEKQYKRMFPSI